MKKRKAPVIPMTILVVMIGGAMMVNAYNNSNAPKTDAHGHEHEEEAAHEEEHAQPPPGAEVKAPSTEEMKANVSNALAGEKPMDKPLAPAPEPQAAAEEGEPMIFNPGVTTASKDGKPAPSQQEKDAAKGNAVMGQWYRQESVISKNKAGK